MTTSPVGGNSASPTTRATTSPVPPAVALTGCTDSTTGGRRYATSGRSADSAVRHRFVSTRPSRFDPGNRTTAARQVPAAGSGPGVVVAGNSRTCPGRGPDTITLTSNGTPAAASE